MNRNHTYIYYIVYWCTCVLHARGLYKDVPIYKYQYESRINITHTVSLYINDLFNYRSLLSFCTYNSTSFVWIFTDSSSCSATFRSNRVPNLLVLEPGRSYLWFKKNIQYWCATLCNDSLPHIRSYKHHIRIQIAALYTVVVSVV
mgnify:CR=1 FL=1